LYLYDLKYNPGNEIKIEFAIIKNTDGDFDAALRQLLIIWDTQGREDTTMSMTSDLIANLKNI